LEMETWELFAQACLEPWSSQVARITGMSHWCLAYGNLLMNSQPVFQRSSTILHSHCCRQWWSLWSEDFQILCVPQGRIHGRTCGYKWSLLKVREAKYKREHGGVLLFSRCF
jgi:hypothetical protein